MMEFHLTSGVAIQISETKIETDRFGEWQSRTETQRGASKDFQLTFVDYSQLV
ncbi:MAG: hypothetical protein ACRDAO_03645 [Culicoidibacterales bacterium]